MSAVQADMQRWKTIEVEYNAEHMEEDVTDVGNATASVPMSVNPLTSTPYFIFGETTEIQSPQPTASQKMPVPVTFPLSFVDPATRANAGTSDFTPMTSEFRPRYSDISPSFFTIPDVRESQGIPIIPDENGPGLQSEEAPQIDESVNVPSDNVTPTGQASLPVGAH